MSDRALHHDIARTERLPVSTLWLERLREAPKPNALGTDVYNRTMSPAFRDPSRKGFGLRARSDEHGAQAVAQVSGTLMPVIFYSSL